MIEIKKIYNPVEQDVYWLYLNGKLLSEIQVRLVKSRDESRNYYNIYSSSVEESNAIFQNRVYDFPPLEYLHLTIKLKNNDFVNSIYISPHYSHNEDGELNILEFSSNKDVSFEISTVIDPPLNEWKYNFTFKYYLSEFLKLLSTRNNLKHQTYSGEPNDYRIVIERIANFDDDLMIIEVERFLGEFISLHQDVLSKINNFEVEPNIITQFDFPDELKIPCEQYLLYFAQFLQDLGINATSNLKEEAGKVLFSVTPTDDVEALDKISEALAVYLNLPSSPIVYDDSFASMRLQAEIERLQSSQRIAEMEFRVAHKALESQDKIILQQSILLEQQAKVIEKITDKAVMINSAENKEELVKIYEGAEFSHSKWLFELTGIKLNPVKVIETAVKNTLGKGDEIIELGLNKEDVEEK